MARKSKLPGGVRPLSAVLRDQGPSGILCGLWSELRRPIVALRMVPIQRYRHRWVSSMLKPEDFMARNAVSISQRFL